MAKLSTVIFTWTIFSSILFIAFCLPHPPDFENEPHECSSVEMNNFLGPWVEVKKKGFRAIADDLKMANDKKDFYKHIRSEMTYSHKGDTWSIDVGTSEIPEKETVSFRFGEYFNSVNIDGSSVKSIIYNKCDKWIERHIIDGDDHVVMDIVRVANGDTLKAWVTVDNITMLVLYRRPWAL